jgi:endonuclease/exonuclease/phosphatase family metal-dependent hydrolase
MAANVPSSGMRGNWFKESNSTAAGQTVLRNPDAGAAKLMSPLANPTDYFEVTFNAEVGKPYRIWVRGRADNNFWGNDSVFAQFSGSLNSTGAPVYRIGTTSGADINLEDCSGCGIQGWGWQDNGWGVGILGPAIFFQNTGPQTLRIQRREDGFSIDQIVLSSYAYLYTSPGLLKNDNTILQSTLGSAPPANQPPQVSISATPTSGNSPLFVSFSSSANDPDGYITSYYWTFGDGKSASVPSPTNTYQSAGSYTASLTVTDNSGASSTATVQINVNSLPPPTSTTLRVLSWNISFGKGTDNVLNWDRTATWIANMNPDLVALCEMPPGDISTLVNLLNQKTGRTWYSHFVDKYAGNWEGNLILSKYNITSKSGRYLSYNRSVAQVTVSVGGKTINFFATHLDPDSSGIRYTQVGELMSWASGFSESRIIAGDVNAGPDTSESIRLTSTYYDSWMRAMNMGAALAYPDNPVGMHTRTRRGRIDYVFYSHGSANLFLQSTQIPDTRDLNNKNVVITLGTLDDKGVRPSDHNPMIATFEVR